MITIRQQLGHRSRDPPVVHLRLESRGGDHHGAPLCHVSTECVSFQFVRFLKQLSFLRVSLTVSCYVIIVMYSLLTWIV